MPQGLQSIGDRLRSFVEERRKFPRRKAVCEVRLPVGVAMPNERISPEAEHYPEPITGRTRDLSEAGMSLELPTVRLGDDLINTKGYPLRIVLSLPGGIIVVHCATIRCDEIGIESGKLRYLLGVSIERINEFDERRYYDFLKSLT